MAPRDCAVVWASQPESLGHAVAAVDVRSLVIGGLWGISAHPERLDAVFRRERKSGDVQYLNEVPA